MSKIDKTSCTGLTKEKKDLLKEILGNYSSPIDLNKVRDEYKDAKN